jgi:acyl carrier protein
MDNVKFLKNFADQFDDIDTSVIKPETRFKDVEGWSSLLAFSVIAMIDEEYNVSLKGDDIRNSSTVNDLFELVKSKL